MSYYDNQEAKVNLMHALVKNGWKVFGYKPDQSDMMVDYWSPAHWNGIAEKDGFVLVVDNRTTSYSGHKVIERNYKQSAINQDRIRKLEALRDDSGATEGEKRNCQAQIDRIRAKQSESEIVKEVYPTFQHGNPRGCNWHIEKDGVIVGKGTGIFSCYQANDRQKQEAIIEKFVSRFEKAIRSAAELVAEEVKQVVKVTKPVEIERKSFQVGDLVKFDWLNGFYKVRKIDIYGDKLAYFFIRLGKKYQELKVNGKNNFYMTAQNADRAIEQGRIKLFELCEVEEVTTKTVYKKAERKQQQSSNTDVMSITGEVIAESADDKTSDHNLPGVTVTLNEEKNGIEVSFDSKPAPEVLAQLKAHGFRWFRPKKAWIAKQTPERLEFARSLSNEPAQEKVAEVISYPEIDIEDIHTYVVDEQLQKREHEASWIFRKGERDRTQEIQALFSERNEQVKAVLSTTDNDHIAYRLKNSLQRYKKKYFANFVAYLQHKANNPSWVVTGRAGRNARKDAKAMTREDKLIRESIELNDWIESEISKAKSAIQRDNEKKVRQQMEQTTVDIEFTVKRQEVTVCGYTKTTRTYIHGDYMIAKTWGAYRIFKHGKEIHSTKTTDKLDDAKKYVAMLVQQDRAQDGTHIDSVKPADTETSEVDTSRDIPVIVPESQLTKAQQTALDARLSKPNVKPLRLFQNKDGYAILECMNTSLETPYPFCFMWDKDGNQKRAGAAEKFNLEQFTLIREYQSTKSQSIQNGTILSHPDLTSEQNEYISKRLAHWQKTGVGVPVRLYKSDHYEWVLLECIHRYGKTMYMRIFNGYADFIYNFRFINRDSFMPIHDFTTVEQEVIQCTV